MLELALLGTGPALGANPRGPLAPSLRVLRDGGVVTCARHDYDAVFQSVGDRIEGLANEIERLRDQAWAGEEVIDVVAASELHEVLTHVKAALCSLRGSRVQ